MYSPYLTMSFLFTIHKLQKLLPVLLWVAIGLGSKAMTQNSKTFWRSPKLMFWNQSIDCKPLDNVLKVKVHGGRMGYDPFRKLTTQSLKSDTICSWLSEFISFFVLFFQSWYKHFAVVISLEKLRVEFSYIKSPNNLDLNCNSTLSGAHFLALAENIWHTSLSAKCSLKTKPLVRVWCCSRRLTQKVHQ